MKLHWTARAVVDLRRIHRFIARDKRGAARDWVRTLRTRARSAARAPRSGRVVPELNHDDIREVLVGSYRLVYRVEPKRIVVLTVFEGHRLLDPDP